MFWFSGLEAHGISVPQPGIEPAPCAFGRQSLNHGKSPDLLNLENFLKSDFHFNVDLNLFSTFKYVLICVNLQFREGNGTPLQYSYLENPMDRGAW